MATINPREDQDKNVIGWQAIIRKRGFPSQTRAFRTKRDAESWAKITESEMLRASGAIGARRRTLPSPGAARRGDRVDKGAQAFDAHCADFSGAKKARGLAGEPHARRGARNDHIARSQGRNDADSAHQRRDIKDHVCGISILEQYPVNLGLQR